MNFHHNNKGMTVVEMLMVLGLLSMLFGLSFYLWNAMDIFRKTRDTQRINDIQVLDTALKTILATEINANLGEENIIYTSLTDSSSTCGSYNLTPLYAPFSYRCSATPTDISGNGWLSVNFTVSKIFIISSLPIDPLNNKDYFYAYQVKQGRYKLTARFEGKNNIPKMANDGGFEPTLYEVGSNLFIPSPHSGLVGYWSFDESTGTIANDLSGYGNNGTMYSGITLTDLRSTSSCKIGYCSSFDGVDDYVQLSTSSSLSITGPITVVVWAYPRATGVNMMFLQASNQYNLWVQSNNKVRFADTLGHYIDTNSGVLTLNQWNHIVGVFVKSSGTPITLSNGNIYINGIPQGIFVSGNWSPTTLSSIAIGRIPSGVNFFNGFIDEVRVYNRALTDSEIKALYDATK
jgi:type II secretory pathway pseudopilin PulG